MSKKKNNPLKQLDDTLNSFGLGQVENMESVTDIDTDIEAIDGYDVEDLDKKEPEVIEEDIVDENEDKKVDNLEEDSKEIPEDVLNKINNSSDEKEDDVDNEQEDDSVEIDENELNQIGMFFDAFAESLHWDVAEDEKPKSVEELIDYIEDVVELNSKPSYADERIAQLDQYVKNGGRFEDFYQSLQTELRYANLDIEDESNLKAVVRDFMKLQGYNDEQITRKIERYEDADMLLDEAEDALSLLKIYEENNIKLALILQEQQKKIQEQQAAQFIDELNQTVSKLDNIRGISIPKEDRKALLDYITKTDANGLTLYQKDFNNNLVNNLLESAYFTMKGDALLSEAKKTGQTSAASKLRKMLKNSTKNYSSRALQEEKTPLLLDVASKFL